VNDLNDALHYLKVEELKEVCLKLQITPRGKKAAMIADILKGTNQTIQPLPSICKAQKGASYPLHPKTLMLNGAFKNDARTRAFFKSLIGPHFHYTVYGLDWLKNRWQQGNPPTYQEFAEFWQSEYLNRKGKKSPLKKEWAYLNFLRNCKRENPHLTKDQLLDRWESTRLAQVKKANRLLFKSDL
jgi:hypothetical protein